jgi:cupin 2 domain-containing protein
VCRSSFEVGRVDLRYVVLRHDGVADPHFDLMFETSPGSPLATWRSPDWPVRDGAPLTHVPDHRADYLTYEGPVSRGRGTVRRVAAGRHVIRERGYDVLVVELDFGAVLRLPRAVFVRHNLLTDRTNAGAEEWSEPLLTGTRFRVERIVSHGQASPPGFWYDQPEDEWVVLLAGAARLRFEGDEPFDLRPGEYVHIPAHARHRVEWTDPQQATVWLAIHFDPGVGGQ